MAQRGGKRQGSGRKANPVKDVRLGQQTAARMRRELKTEAKLKEIFETCGDASLQTKIIFKLWEFDFGKPVQAVEVSNRPDQVFRVTIEDIGRTKG